MTNASIRQCRPPNRVSQLTTRSRPKAVEHTASSPPTINLSPASAINNNCLTLEPVASVRLRSSARLLEAFDRECGILYT